MKPESFIPALSYDFLTPAYDAFANLLGFGVKEREKIVNLLELKSGEKLLDVGCGTGTFVVVAKKLHPGAEVVGIDIDQKILAYAREKVAREKLDIRLIHTRADDLPFPDGSFDAVVSTLVFHHLPTPLKQSSMREIKRVLTGNGRFLLVDFGKADSFSMKGLYLLERLLGFRETETLKDNLEGKLPIFLEETGFHVTEVAPKHKGLEYLLAAKRT